MQKKYVDSIYICVQHTHAIANDCQKYPEFCVRAVEKLTLKCARPHLTE